MPKKEIPSYLMPLFTRVAAEHLLVETLETRNSDSLDFHDVSVVGIRDALYEAYCAGLEFARAQASNPEGNDVVRDRQNGRQALYVAGSFVGEITDGLPEYGELQREPVRLMRLTEVEADYGESVAWPEYFADLDFRSA